MIIIFGPQPPSPLQLLNQTPRQTGVPQRLGAPREDGAGREPGAGGGCSIGQHVMPEHSSHQTRDRHLDFAPQRPTTQLRGPEDQDKGNHQPQEIQARGCHHLSALLIGHERFLLFPGLGRNGGWKTRQKEAQKVAITGP
ncbi:hypothetical protein N7475_007123 [Penicillium sp. IBT 31633x]|nr:hypothetical protein N7475_007123 [Penicillium sp. IBT 31633x]